MAGAVAASQRDGKHAAAGLPGHRPSGATAARQRGETTRRRLPRKGRPTPQKRTNLARESRPHEGKPTPQEEAVHFGQFWLSNIELTTSRAESERLLPHGLFSRHAHARSKLKGTACRARRSERASPIDEPSAANAFCSNATCAFVARWPLAACQNHAERPTEQGSNT